MFYICSFYRPPDSNMYPIVQLNESLTKLPNSESMVLFGGDFNFLYIAWFDGYGTLDQILLMGVKLITCF